MKIIKSIISKFKSNKVYEYIGIALLLLILTAVLYPKVFFSGNIISSSDFLLLWEPWKNLITQPYAAKNYVISDLIEASYPLATHILNGLRHGEIPLWYNLSGMGSSSGATFLATFLTNPVVLILSLINNFNIGTGLSTAVIFFSVFRGFFTYLLLREFGLKRFSSLIGAVVFTFCLYNIVWGLDSLSHVASVIPFCLWATERLFKHVSKVNIIVFAVSYAFLVLGGFPSTVFYASLLVALFILSKSIYRLVRKSEKSSEVLKRLGIFLVSGIVAIGLTAFTLIPTADILFNKFDISYRGASHSEIFFDKIYLTRYLVPGILGNPTHYDYQQQPFQPVHSTNFSESSGYVGVLTLILAFFAIFRIKSDKKVLFFALLSLLAVLIAFKIGPFLDIVKLLPVFNSNPSTRLILIPSFGFSVLAAYGMNALLTEDKKKLMNGFLVSLVLQVGVSTLLLLYVSRFTNGLMLFDKRIFFEFTKYFLVIIGGNFLIFFLINKNLKEVFIKAGILLLIFLDLFAIGKGYLPQIEKDKYYPVPQSIKFLQEQSQSSRFRVLGFDEIFLSATPAVYGLNSITQMTHYDERWATFTNLLQPNSLELARKTVRFRKYKTSLNSQLLDLANVRYVLDHDGEDNLSDRAFAEVKDFNKTLELTGSDYVEQTFLAPANTDITTIKIRVESVEKFDSTPLVLQVLDENNKQIDRYEISNPVIGENSVEDTDTIVDLPSVGTYTLKISWKTTTSNKVELFAVTPLVLYKEGELFKNGTPEIGDLTFSIDLHDSETEEGYKLVYDDEVNIYENEDYFNRAFLTHNLVKTTDMKDSESQLIALSDKKELDTTAIIENPVKDITLDKCEDTSSDSAEIVTYKSNQVDVATSSKCDSILVFSDLYDKDWKVQVDGVESELLLADYLMRGVYVPEGEHTLHFTYAPQSSKTGLYVSLISIGIVTSFALYPQKKKRKKS